MLCIDFLEQVPALQVSAKEAIGETSIFFWTHEDMWYLRWLHNYDSELTVLLLFFFSLHKMLFIIYECMVHMQLCIAFGKKVRFFSCFCLAIDKWVGGYFWFELHCLVYVRIFMRFSYRCCNCTMTHNNYVVHVELLILFWPKYGTLIDIIHVNH